MQMPSAASGAEGTPSAALGAVLPAAMDAALLTSPPLRPAAVCSCDPFPAELPDSAPLRMSAAVTALSSLVGSTAPSTLPSLTCRSSDSWPETKLDSRMMELPSPPQAGRDDTPRNRSFTRSARHTPANDDRSRRSSDPATRLQPHSTLRAARSDVTRSNVSMSSSCRFAASTDACRSPTSCGASEGSPSPRMMPSRRARDRAAPLRGERASWET
mmetsp:Transcript_2903/g.11803  ORF Transcript_2903/g.11803 Transcript_2903/m.11803 type:complete len:215 (+) Transcript_2903:2423-3067(+)